MRLMDSPEEWCDTNSHDRERERHIAAFHFYLIKVKRWLSVFGAITTGRSGVGGSAIGGKTCGPYSYMLTLVSTVDFHPAR